MSESRAIADRFEIGALRGEFTDAVMMRDYDRFASLFTPDGAWRIPYINAELVSREEIRAGIERMQGVGDMSGGCPTGTSRTSPPRCAMRSTTSRRSIGEASICSWGRKP